VGRGEIRRCRALYARAEVEELLEHRAVCAAVRGIAGLVAVKDGRARRARRAAMMANANFEGSLVGVVWIGEIREGHTN
jgi:hypothetical protein